MIVATNSAPPQQLTSPPRTGGAARCGNAGGDPENPMPDSTPSTDWDLALRHPAAWENARWIGLPAEHFFRDEAAGALEIPRGKWIGNTEKSRFYVRRAFTLPESRTIQSAWLRIEADNRFDLWINGAQMPLPSTPESWRNLAPLEVSALLQPGDNLLSIRAYETDSPDWFISALRGGMRVDFEDNDGPLLLETDADWQATEVTWPKVFLDKAFTEEKWLESGFADHAPPDICQSLHPRQTRRSWMGRKVFHVGEPIVQAIVYATARGIYELSLNGQRVGRDLLTPHHLPNDRYQYQAYDVTSLIRSGANCLGVLTGGGFFNTIGHSGLTAGAPLFLAQLEWHDGGKEKRVLVSDASWKVSPSPLLEDSPQYGERYDARLEQPGWNEPAFDDSRWAPACTETIPAQLEPQECETVQVAREISGCKLPPPAPGLQLFDFGINSSGRLRLTLRNTAPGQRVIIRHGELLADEGGVFHGPYRNVIYPDEPQARFMMRNIDTYICRGDAKEVFEPRFCYTGFRYAQIEGCPSPLAPEDFVKLEFYNALPERGTFTCADPLLNGIYDMARNSWTSNLHGAPTDCPTREKQHWEDVGVQVGRTALWLTESERLLARWMTKGQRLGGTVGWEDMDIELPWEIHLFTGDTTLMRSHWPVMQALVEKRLARLEDGLFTGREVHQWLDHTALEPTDHEIFCSAFLWHNLDLMQKMAGRLGKCADTDHYRRLRDDLGAAIHEQLFDASTGTYRNGTQTAQLLPLAFGITPTDRREAVFHALVEDIEKHGGALTTGMTGTRYLLPVLSAHGRHDLALALANRTTFPSWGHWMAKGATAMAETWDTWDLPQDQLRLRSFNHPNYGSIGEWFFESLGGLQPDEDHPGFEHFFVRPQVDGPLTQVEVEYRSVRGLIRSAWKTENGRLELRVEVPAGTTATIRVLGQEVSADNEADVVRTEPGATLFQVGAGNHTFRDCIPPGPPDDH
jgi:alpha-L-rhamnosidase